MKFPALDVNKLLAPGKQLVEGWRAFWFTPADPTVLGVIRICTGFVLFYILMSSGPLLPSIYAPDGWVDLKTADLIRRETPWFPDVAENRPAGYMPDPMTRREDVPPLVRPELSRAPWAEEYRQRWYVDPGQTTEMGLPLFSQWFHVTSPFWREVVHGLAIFVAVLLTLGLGTRVVAVLAWALTLGYIHRTQASLFGMDTMIAILLLYLIVAPAGATLSLDRLIQRFRRSFAALSKRQPAPGLTLQPSVSANVALRLLQIHFCLIYLASGTSKLQGPAWWNGSAIWQTLANYEFTPVRFSFFTPMLHFLADHRLLWELFHAGSTIFTLSLEIGLPFLIWYPRWRWVMIIGAVMLHTGIALSMGLVAFSMLMIVILFAFLPAAPVKALLARVFKGPARLWLLIASRQGVGVRLGSLVHALDAWGQVKIVDVSAPLRAEEEPAWLQVPAHLAKPQLASEPDVVLSGYPLVERLVRSLRILWPVALLTWMPGVGKLGRTIAPCDEQEIPEEVGGRT